MRGLGAGEAGVTDRGRPSHADPPLASVLSPAQLRELRAERLLLLAAEGLDSPATRLEGFLDSLAPNPNPNPDSDPYPNCAPAGPALALTRAEAEEALACAERAKGPGSVEAARLSALLGLGEQQE